MRIIMMTSLALCLTASMTAPAAARHRHHVRPYEQPEQVQYFPAFQPPMMAAFPGAPMPRPARAMRRLPMQAAWGGPPMFGAMPEASVPGPRRARRAPQQQSAMNSMAMAGPSGFGGGGDLIAEARRYIGGNPTGRSSLWCGNFMNLVLEHTGHRASASNQARSFASYGQRLPGPQVGAIAVMGRRGGGHVGVVSGIDAGGNPIIISGNHGHRVAEASYSRGSVYAYVMP
jgi:uncharacterized protein (TIGR02594 family)